MKKIMQKKTVLILIIIVLSLFCFICCSYECDYFRLMMNLFKGTENEQPLLRDFVLMLLSSIFSLIIFIISVLSLIYNLKRKNV